MPGQPSVLRCVESGRFVYAPSPHVKRICRANEAGLPRRRGTAPRPAAVFRLENSGRADVHAARAGVQAEPAAPRAGKEWAGKMATRRTARNEILWIAEVGPVQPTVVGAEEGVIRAVARGAVATVARQQPGSIGGGGIQAVCIAGRSAQPGYPGRAAVACLEDFGYSGTRRVVKCRPTTSGAGKANRGDLAMEHRCPGSTTIRCALDVREARVLTR